MTHMTASAATVFSDDFATNPFASRWTYDQSEASYPLYWTGAGSPPSGGLPANANNNSVYSGAYGSYQSMSSVDTTVPVGVTGWTSMTYSLDFQMGGTVVGNSIGLLANRSGNNGYNAAIYTGGSGNIAFYGDYGLAWTGINAVANIWYTFKTTLTKSGTDISMQSQILDLSNTVLGTSPIATFANATYLNPNGFYIKFGHNPADYWSQATQIDNFVVTAIPEPSALAMLMAGGLASLVMFRRRRAA